MQVIHAGYKIKFKDIRWSGSYKLNPSPVIDSAQKFSEGIYEPSTLQCLSFHGKKRLSIGCLLYTSPSPRDQRGSRMPSSA